MTFDGKTYTADFTAVDYYPVASTTTSLQFNVFLPDAGDFPKPSGGYPVVFFNELTDYTTTASAPTTLVSSSQHTLWQLLQRGIAVVWVPLTGAWASAGVQETTAPGRGLWHPPGKVVAADGGEDPANSDAWSDDDKPNAVKEFMWAVQKQRSLASAHGTSVDPRKTGVVGNVGTSGSGDLGFGSATVAALVALMPDGADPDATDHTVQSTRVGAALVTNFQGDWEAYDGTQTGLAPGGGAGDNFSSFPDGFSATALADTLDAVPAGYLREFSPSYVGFRSSEDRDRNSTNVAFYIYVAGHDSVSIGLAAGTEYLGSDTPSTGKSPNWVSALDPTDLDDQQHPIFGWILLDRLLDIEGVDEYHTTNSRLVTDAATFTALGTLTGVDNDIAETTTFEAADFWGRAEAEAQWFADTFELPDAEAEIDATKLGAVNAVLSGMGVAAVTTLGGTTASINAEAQLDLVTEQVQGQGWHFNAEEHVTVEPGPDGTILVGSDVLFMDAMIKRINVTIRNGKLYDLEAGTFIFTNPIQVERQRLLPLEDIPVYARTYIVARATRLFQDRFLGSDSLAASLRADEEKAYADMKLKDADAGDYNALEDNVSTAQILIHRGGAIFAGDA